MRKSRRKNSVAGRIAKAYVTWIIVAPIYLGVFFGMMLLFGIGIFLLAFPGFWLLADPSMLWSPGGSTWLKAFILGPYPMPALLIIEVIIFSVGLFLFCLSLFTLLHEKSQHKNKLVQSGPYRFIRHPQHLGLIIMLLPLALYIPSWGGDLGIRFGDLISWTQFAFLLAVFSDWEDLQLRKKFPATYPEYYGKTGFLSPKIFPSKHPGYFSVFRHRRARYVLFIILYVLIVSALYVLYLSVPVMQWD